MKKFSNVLKMEENLFANNQNDNSHAYVLSCLILLVMLGLLIIDNPFISVQHTVMIFTKINFRYKITKYST